MLYIYHIIIPLIFGVISLDVAGFSHLNVTWAKIDQNIRMTFYLRQAGGKGRIFIRFRPEETSDVYDFLSVVTATRQVEFHSSYLKRITVETNDYPTVSVTLKKCQMTDAGDYLCMSEHAEIADCGFRVHVWEPHLREISVHEHENAKFAFKIGGLDKSAGETVTVKFRHRGRSEPLEDVLSIQTQSVQVQVNQAYTQRVLAMPDTRLKLVEVKLLEVTLHDAGEYSCYYGPVKLRADGCGYILDVLIFESEDPNQVNSLEHQDVDLLFNISETLSNTVIKVLFQHSAAREMTEVATLKPLNQTIEAAQGYVTRLSLITVIAQHIFHIRLEEVTLNDDGSYKCQFDMFMYSIILGECGQKLNVFAKAMKHVIIKSWHVFTGDTIRAVCDRQRFMFPREVKRINEIRLRKRKWAEKTFKVIATYPDNRNTSAKTTDSSQDPSTAQLLVNMTTNNDYVMEEFDCTCNLTTETETMILYSLISLVTVRYLKDTSALEGSTITLTFNLIGVEEHHYGPLQIMFRRLHSNEHEHVLSVHMPDMTVSVSEAFAGRTKHRVDLRSKKLDLQLLNVALDETGDFYCFAGSQEIHLPGCGYKLIVEVEESDDLSQVNTLEYRDIEVKLQIVPDTTGSDLIHVKFERPDISANVLTLDPVKSSVEMAAQYSTRFYSVDSHPSLKLGLHHATLADDGFFRCYLGETMTWLSECGVKLNVFASRVKRVISKSWKIFEGDNISARCDRNRIPTPEKITRTVSVAFNYRRVNETTVQNIANCNVTNNVICAGVGKYVARHVPEMGNMSDYTAMDININSVRVGDSGEYHCHWTVETEAGRKNIFSLASLINVRVRNEISAFENTNVTMTFDIGKIKTVDPEVLIKFCNQSSASQSSASQSSDRCVTLLKVTVNSLEVELVANKNQFVTFKDYISKKVTLGLRRATENLAGQYQCFSGQSTTPIGNCGFRLTVQKSPTNDNNAERPSATQSPKENVAEVSTVKVKAEVINIEARENEDLTITFNIAQINSLIKMIRIKFQKDKEQTWTDLVEVYRSQKYIDFFKSQTDFVSVSLDEDKNQLIIRLPKVTQNLLGNYKCFEGSSMTPVLSSQCDYRITLKSSLDKTTASYNASTQTAADILYLYILVTLYLYIE